MAAAITLPAVSMSENPRRFIAGSVPRANRPQAAQASGSDTVLRAPPTGFSSALAKGCIPTVLASAARAGGPLAIPRPARDS